ncbi:unnamed protein product [Cuscuta epithymum]|uniref:Reverse transcriptase zinc-binding domain-containing protein n=1 Tax=Cuscuta epithymum TaxID=186058 RepID=A0AAV0EDL6_9ASTE|nr:unnamed protein product [Cuscuta epithymum]
MDRACTFCYTHVETVAHLFFQCPNIGKIWNDICLWLGVKQHITTLAAAVKCFKKFYAGARIKSKAVRIAMCCTIHTVWKARNKLVFEKKATPSNEIFLQIKLLTYKSM